MYIGYERIDVTAAVQTQTAFTIPAGTVYAELQADAGDIRYTMGGSVDPSKTLPRGMLLRTTDHPKAVDLASLKLMKFTQDTGAATAGLNLAYIGS